MRTLLDRKGRLPIAIIMAVVLVLCLVAGAFTYTRVAKKPKGEGSAESKPARLSMWKMEEFVVNLADRAEPHYLKVSMTLEVDGKVESGGEGGGNPLDAKAQDAIITVLTRKRFAELLTEQGKSKLKSELKSALNDALGEEPKVVNIYFTSFAMQ